MAGLATGHAMSGSPPQRTCSRPGLSTCAIETLSAVSGTSADGRLRRNMWQSEQSGDFTVGFGVSLDGFNERRRIDHRHAFASSDVGTTFNQSPDNSGFVGVVPASETAT